MSVTVGFENATSFVRSRDPSVQAVWAVNAGKERELSITSICSSSRGGMAMTGSAAMFVCVDNG